MLGGRSGGGVLVDEEVSNKLPIVQTASVRELSRNAEPLRLLGTVSSRSEANVRTEAQGRITQVLVSEGDRVRQGQRIAAIENSVQFAAVEQARAALASAEASIDKAQTLTQVSLESAERNVRETQVSTLNSLEVIYTQVDDAVRGQADILFSNADTTNPRLLFIVSADQQARERLEIQRREIGRVLNLWQAYTLSLDESAVTVETIDRVEEYVEEVRNFLSDLVSTTSLLQSSENVSQTQITSWKSAVSGARSVVNGVISSLTGLRSAFIQTEANLQVAQEESSQSLLSPNTTAQTTVAQAQSALRAAEVGLAKTVITAPISGVVSRLDIEAGDFVSILEPVVQVSNDQSLEVVTYVTEEESELIARGATARIGDRGIAGEVVLVAPTIDSDTQKIEVKIAPESSVGFIDGQSVSVRIDRQEKDPDQILIPLTAMKVLPAGASVLIVNEEGFVEPQSIVVGPVVGDRVLVYEGLTLDQSIVRDVRGLQSGDRVDLQ